MINIYIDQLSAADALDLFNYISERDYLSSAECDCYQSGHNSSIRMECFNKRVFADLERYFEESR